MTDDLTERRKTLSTVERISFTVPGLPVAQPRQRHARFGGKIRNYTPTIDPVNAFKAAIKIVASQHCGELLTGPVRMEITCCFARPQSHFRTGKSAGEVKPGMPIWHITKPDSDNVAKAVKDALTGVAYADDKQVCFLVVRKSYNAIPHTEITIQPLDGEVP